jgi:ketosteroid isomerase-like protein
MSGDWAMLSSSTVKVREVVASGDRIMAEITIEAVMNGRPLAVEAVVAHRWRDGRLVRYRLYSDPVPLQVAAKADS